MGEVSESGEGWKGENITAKLGLHLPILLQAFHSWYISVSLDWNHQSNTNDLELHDLFLITTLGFNLTLDSVNALYARRSPNGIFEDWFLLNLILEF